MLRRSPEEQRLALAHECEHLHARDPLLLAAAWIAAALIPWNPAVWWMLARLRLAVELDCDARVLRRGAAPRSYGALLIELAAGRSGLRAGALAFAEPPSHLERRLLAMTSHPSRFPLLRGSALAVVAALALLAACDAPLPTSEEIDRMDAASAEQVARKVGLLTDSAVSYWIDGVRANAEQVRALSPDVIAAIEATRARRAARDAEIRITTRQVAAARGGKPSAQLMRVGVTGTPTLTERGQVEAIATAAGRTPFAGLLLIDGKRAGDDARRVLSPNQISSIEVIKGAEAVKRYADPRAANGVISVTTRHGAPTP